MNVLKLLQILTYLLLLLCVFSTSHSQEIEILQDSLKKMISPEEKAQILSNIGLYYFQEQVYFDSAYFYTNRALDIAKEHKLSYEELRATFNLGAINNEIGKREDAIKNYEAAIILLKKQGLRRLLSTAYNNIGGVYFETTKFNKAIDYYTKSLVIANEINDTIAQGISFMNIGEAYFKLDKLDISKENLEKSKQLLIASNTHFSTVHLFYARTLFALKEIKKAKVEASRSLTLAKEEKDLKYISEASQLLAEIFEKENDFQNAFTYQKQYIAYNESLNEAKELNEVEKLKLNFELKEKKEEIALITQRNKYQNIIAVLAAAGLSLLVVLIFRQRKIVRMTNNIHDIQKRLVETELKSREQINLKNATGFEAAISQDLD